EIPRWLKEDDLEKYFGAVLLSCVEGIRKPDPRISDKACRILGVTPERCVYIGDNLDRDVEGTRLAGYGMFILYTTPEKLAKEKITDANRPDAVIFDFNELKDIFPKAPYVAWDKIRRV
ncbi:MAG: HAD-IA family hydrolase, partial [Spirochaetales bacterium]|nr:HAD-IA family hydrolase [Spirochaetales bacterium]